MAEPETAVAPEIELPSPTEAQAEPTQEQPEPAATEEVTEEPIAETKEAAPFDPYEALDREEMKPVLEQRDKRRERELRATLEGEYAEKTRNWEATQAANTLAGYVGNILQKVADADHEGMDRSVQSLMQFAQPLMNDYRRAVQEAEIKTAARALSFHMSQSLGRAKDRDAFDAFMEAKSPTWQDAFKEYVRLASGDELAKKDAEIARLNDVIGKTKAEGRTNKGPSLAQGAPGGGARYSQMSREERAKLSSAEIDALVARELRGE